MDTTHFTEAQGNDIRKRYDVMGYPTTVLIGTDGKMQSVAGKLGADQMLALMQAVK